MDRSSGNGSENDRPKNDGAGTEQSARALLMKLRTIFHLVDRIVAASIDRNELVPQDNVAHLLCLAQECLDKLNHLHQKIH